MNEAQEQFLPRGRIRRENKFCMIPKDLLYKCLILGGSAPHPIPPPIKLIHYIT